MTCIASCSRAIRAVPAPLAARPALRIQAGFTPRRYASSGSPAPKPKSAKKPLSSCAPGTVLTGLNILKDQPEVKALPDEEYPAWLWTILDKPKAADAELGMRRPAELKDAKDFAGYKKQLRSQNRSNIKASNYLKTT